MLRNLLYSICLHIFIALFMYFGKKIDLEFNTINVNHEVTSNNTINMEEFLSEIKEDITKKSKVENLNLMQKYDLYKKVKAYETLESKQRNKKNEKQKYQKNIMVAVENIENSELIYPIKTADNKINITTEIKDSNITKTTHKIFIGEKNFTKKEIATIKKTEEVKKEIRKNLKEETKPLVIKKIAPVENYKKKIDKPIKIYKKKETSLKNIVKKEEERKETLVVETEDFLDYLELSSLDDDVKQFTDIKSEEIFTKKDIKDLKKYEEDSAKNMFQLSLREKSEIQKQIRYCYKNAIINSGKNSKIIVAVTIKLYKNGRIDMKNVTFKVDEKESRKISKVDYQIAIDNAKLALIYCNPLRNLPATKYYMWKNMSFVFDSIN